METDDNARYQTLYELPFQEGVFAVRGDVAQAVFYIEGYWFLLAFDVLQIRDTEIGSYLGVRAPSQH